MKQDNRRQDAEVFVRSSFTMNFDYSMMHIMTGSLKRTGFVQYDKQFLLAIFRAANILSAEQKYIS